MTTSDHEGDLIKISLLCYYDVITESFSHYFILLSHENCYLLYKRPAGDLKYLPKKPIVFIENVGLLDFPPPQSLSLSLGDVQKLAL